VLEHSGRTDSDLIVPSVREPTRFGILKRYLCRAAAGRESRAARSFCAGLARISCANSHRFLHKSKINMLRDNADSGSR
jgi:hypothetical protein